MRDKARHEKASTVYDARPYIYVGTTNLGHLAGKVSFGASRGNEVHTIKIVHSSRDDAWGPR